MKLKMENFADCVTKIAAKGKISSNQAAELLQFVANEGEKLRAKGEANPFLAAAGKLGTNLLERVQKEHADAVINAGKRAEMLARVDTSGSPAGVAERLRAMLYWMPGHGNARSVQSLSTTLASHWMSYFNDRLKKAGLIKFAANREAFRSIANAIWDAKAGRDVSKLGPATQVGQAVIDTMATVRKRLNSAGAYINDAKDFITNQLHSPEMMLRGGRGQEKAANIPEAFDRWYRLILPKLNIDKTFSDLFVAEGQSVADAQRRFLRDVFGVLTTGIKKDGGTAASRIYEGTSNIARKLSEGKILFFKDADSWVDYMEAYGRLGNFYEATFHAVHQGSRNAALMEMLGTNPMGNFRQVVQALQEKYRDTHPLEAAAIEAQLKRSNLTGQPDAEKVLALLGAVPRVATEDLESAITMSIAQGYNMISLGNVGLMNLAFSTVSMPATLRMAGMNTFKALGSFIASVVPDSLKGEERRAVLQELGAYAEGAIAPPVDPLMNGVTAPGVISNLHSKYMTASGIRYVLQKVSNGAKWAMSSHLASRLRMTPYEALDAATRSTLADYGVGAREWALLKQARLTNAKGIDYLTPSSVDTIPDAAFGLEGEALANAREEFKTNLAVYFTDLGEHAATNPGVREKALLSAPVNSNKSTQGWIALGTQFMGGPLAAMHQTLGRLIYNSTTKTEAAFLIGTFAAISTIAGYIGLQARNLAAGRPLDDPKDWKQSMYLALRSFSAGGLLSVYGDLIFGQIGQNQEGNGIGGPLPSDLKRLSDIWYKFNYATNNGTKYNAWAALARFGLGHMPGANLFYAKGALDYLLFHHLQEAIQPGWWDKTNQKLLKERGKAMAGYMPGAPIPYTPFGIGQ